MSDETAAPAASSARASGAVRNASRRYPVEAHRDHQPRLIDLIPHSLTKLFLLFFVGTLAIAGIEAIYATRALEFSEGHLPAFDLRGRRKPEQLVHIAGTRRVLRRGARDLFVAPASPGRLSRTLPRVAVGRGRLAMAVGRRSGLSAPEHSGAVA